MHAIQLKSKVLGAQLRAELQQNIQHYRAKGFRSPKLAIILLGHALPSVIYVRNKKRACQKIGIEVVFFHENESMSEDNLFHLIQNLNEDSTVDGILVQLPLPKSITLSRILAALDPSKDVDGFHPYNIGLLAQGYPRFRPCTPYGIMQLLDTLPLSLCGLHAVIVGASNIVGKPMAFELLQAGCTVTICHIHTKGLQQHIQQADLLISAIGKTNVIQTKWIKPGSIIIDVGINRAANGSIKGDIDFDSAINKAYAITPVPGGIGPMTVTALMSNTWMAYQAHVQQPSSINHQGLDSMQTDH